MKRSCRKIQLVGNSEQLPLTVRITAIHSRADATKPNAGLTSFRGAKVRKADVAIAKNYLNEDELAALNNLVEQYLIFAEGQAMRRIPMHMADWIGKLDGFLTIMRRVRLSLYTGEKPDATWGFTTAASARRPSATSDDARGEDKRVSRLWSINCWQPSAKRNWRRPKNRKRPKVKA